MVRAWRKRISMVSHNIQKFAKKKNEKCKRKEVVIRSILKEEIPDLYLLQEVTSQNFFKEEMQCLRSSDYYVAMGPSFSSGSYGESYPLIFNLATIHYAPLPYRMNGRMANKVIPFSIRGKKSRANTYFEVFIPKGRYNLRPPKVISGDEERDREYDERHSNLAHRKYLEYYRLRIFAVHTSPGLDLNKQIQSVISALEKEGEKVACMAVGDFYGEKGARRTMKKYAEKIDFPDKPTNFKLNGEASQRADLFMRGYGVALHGDVRTIFPHSVGIDDGAGYLKAGIDHAAIKGTYEVVSSSTVTAGEIIEKHQLLYKLNGRI